MMKEFVVNIPEGYEIDQEKSTFERIIFKKIEEPKWRDDKNQLISGCYIDTICNIRIAEGAFNTHNNYNVFASEKHAKRAIAEARISQIMYNDERFGGVITDEEWSDETITKYVIYRSNNLVISDYFSSCYHFLSFHTEEQRDLFLMENLDWVKDYFMLD